LLSWTQKEQKGSKCNNDSPTKQKCKVININNKKFGFEYREKQNKATPHAIIPPVPSHKKSLLSDKAKHGGDG